MDYYGRNVMLMIGNLGTEPKLLISVLNSQNFITAYDQIRNRYAGKKIYLGIDHAHAINGVILKLNAFESTMQSLTKNRNSVIFIQILIEANNSSHGSRVDILNQIIKKKNEINERFGYQIIDVIHQEISLEERCAFMKLSLGFLNTSIRQNLYLAPFEYIAVNQEKFSKIIISEFAGVSHALCSLRRINPFDSDLLESEIYDMIVDNPCTQSYNKRKRDIEYIHKSTTLRWAHSFLTDLKRSHKNAKRFQYVVHGFGDKLKIITLRKRFCAIDPDTLLKAYKKTIKRVFIFDFKDTLGILQKQMSQASPSKNLCECLRQLCDDPKNIVFVITEETKQTLEDCFENMPKLGMAAEDGALLRIPNTHQ